MKSSLLALILIGFVAAGCSASTDTSLVLKPTAEQVHAAKPATNKLCPVSGDSIGAMGEGLTVIYKGQAVQLCCGGCVKAFGKDPAKFTAVATGAARKE